MPAEEQEVRLKNAGCTVNVCGRAVRISYGPPPKHALDVKPTGPNWRSSLYTELDNHPRTRLQFKGPGKKHRRRSTVIDSK